MTIHTRLAGIPATLPCVVAMRADATAQAVLEPRPSLAGDNHLRGVTVQQNGVAFDNLYGGGGI